MSQSRANNGSLAIAGSIRSRAPRVFKKRAKSSSSRSIKSGRCSASRTSCSRSLSIFV
ncbi:MAG: 30S ribosomal protein S30e [Phycisphaerales bacterium]|nr:30S ribosomal protein S30e [Phycisphaerales bacterium]